MLRLLLASLLLAGCSVDPRVDDKPCPCAPGFVCVADRCVEGDAVDAGDALDGGRVVDSGDVDMVDAGPPAPGTVQLDFASGTHDATVVDGEGGLTLGSNRPSGTWRSEVIDRVDAPALRELRWIPDAPYAKPMPRDRSAESGYAMDAVSMSENVVLYDFADAVLTAGRMVMDKSGRGNSGVVVASVPVVQVAAPVGFGVAFQLDSYLLSPFDRTTDLQLGTSDFTWTAWVRTTQPSEDMTNNNRVFFGTEEDVSRNPHIWFGLSNTCNGADPGAYMGGHLRSAAGDDGDGYCGTSVVNDGEWHLVTLTKRGHADAIVTVFVDGELESATPHPFNGPIAFSETEAMHYGSFVDGSFATIVDMSQIAIFRRALGPMEVRALHRRSALRVAVRLRECVAVDCSDDPPFVGPDGTPATAYRDPADNLAPPVLHEVVLRGDYLQVEVRLETDLPDTPRITGLTLAP